MDILIIGNGFDLAHGLPTKYTDFLQICSIAKTAKVSWIENKASSSCGYSEKERKALLIKFTQALGMELYEEFREKIRNCFWIDHFLKKKVS